MNLSVICAFCNKPIWFWQHREEEVEGFYHDRCHAEADQLGWMCNCGNWQDDDFHCSKCGAEPPWGCDCGEHEEEPDEPEEEDIDFVESLEDDADSGINWISPVF